MRGTSENEALKEGGRWLIVLSPVQKPVWDSELSLIWGSGCHPCYRVGSSCLWRMPLITTTSSHLFICPDAHHLILSRFKASPLWLQIFSWASWVYRSPVFWRQLVRRWFWWSHLYFWILHMTLLPSPAKNTHTNTHSGTRNLIMFLYLLHQTRLQTQNCYWKNVRDFGDLLS